MGVDMRSLGTTRIGLSLTAAVACAAGVCGQAQAALLSVPTVSVPVAPPIHLPSVTVPSPPSPLAPGTRPLSRGLLPSAVVQPAPTRSPGAQIKISGAGATASVTATATPSLHLSVSTNSTYSGGATGTSAPVERTAPVWRSTRGGRPAPGTTAGGGWLGLTGASR